MSEKREIKVGDLVRVHDALTMGCDSKGDPTILSELHGKVGLVTGVAKSTEYQDIGKDPPETWQETEQYIVLWGGNIGSRNEEIEILELVSE